jgi:hypothetical protein
MTEKQFQQQILDLARLMGWKVYFTWNSVHSPAGFPDLAMVRGARLIFAELKTDTGKVTPAQTEWLDALKTVQGKFVSVEVYLWRPADFDQIVSLLR